MYELIPTLCSVFSSTEGMSVEEFIIDSYKKSYICMYVSIYDLIYIDKA